MAHHSSGRRVQTLPCTSPPSSSAPFFAQAAAVTTGPAESVTTGSAVVTGTVDPRRGDDLPLRVRHVDELRARTPDARRAARHRPGRRARDAHEPDVEHDLPLPGRRHGGASQGADRTFKTATPAAAPSISVASATGVGATGATLRARVNPRGLATTVRFEYGTSTSYGTATPEQAIGAGTLGRDRRAPRSAACAPNTRYNYRAVATSAAGDHARRQPLVHDRARPDRRRRSRRRRSGPIWGSGLTITGTVSGAGSTPVALEKQDFPYTGPCVQVATATANSQRRVHAHRAAAVRHRAPARRHAHRGRRPRAP